MGCQPRAAARPTAASSNLCLLWLHALCAEMAKSQPYERRGGEGREETSRTFPASSMWSRAVQAAPLQGCSSEVARWGAGLGMSPEEKARRVF